MADLISDALEKIAAQSLAQNPYAQFGSVLSQQKNPYATAEDPWGALAANAAQQLFAGISSGYGQAQVQNEMNQVNQIVPQLYTNPGAVQTGDSDILSYLQRQALAQQAANKQKLQQVGLEEFAKASSNPLTQMQTEKALFDFAQGMSEQTGRPFEETYAILKGLKSPSSASQAPAAAPSQIPSPDQVFKGPPAIAPTQQAQMQPQVPAGQSQEMPVPDIAALTEQFRQGGKVPFAKASEAAQAEYKRIMDANAAQKLEKLKQSGEEAKQSKSAEIQKQENLTKKLAETNDAFGSLDQNISLLEEAIPNLPDYGNPITGGTKKLYDELMARNPLGGKAAESSKAALDAIAKLNLAKPEQVGDLIKKAKLAPVTDVDLNQILKGLPGEYNTKEQNAALLNTLKSSRDFIKFQNAFWQAGAKRGLNEDQILQKWNEKRALLGGSFMQGGSLNPKVTQDLPALLQFVGGGSF